MIARYAAWLCVPVLLAGMIVLSLRQPSSYLMGDFRAFYCAGSAIALGADPYREQPLHACELRAGPPAEPAALRVAAIPAPLPPHALLAFVPLSRLPFATAALVFMLASLGAFAASVVVFARVTRVSSIELNLVFAAVTATVAMFVGQPMSFVLLALAGTAWFARERRWWQASACACAATIEPHLALPAIAAMAVALPRTRIPLLGCLAAAAALGALVVGPATTVEYVRDVLPAHALANAYEWQYSLTSVLTSMGVGAPLAVHLGEGMFAAMAALGVAVAVRLRAVTGDAATLAIVPPAFAVFGGVHVHVQQIAVAFPAALYVCAHFPSVRAVAARGVVLAMIPWNVMCSCLMVGFVPPLVGTFAATQLGRRAGLRWTLAAAAIACSLYALAGLGYGPAEAHPLGHSYPAGGLAEVSWGAFSRVAMMRTSLLMQWLRVPTLAGLACIVFGITRAAFPGIPERESDRSHVTPVRATPDSCITRPSPPRNPSWNNVPPNVVATSSTSSPISRFSSAKST